VIMTFEVEATVREENDLLINPMISCEKCILTLSPPAFFFLKLSASVSIFDHFQKTSWPIGILSCMNI